jgi:hypothetical protein
MRGGDGDQQRIPHLYRAGLHPVQMTHNCTGYLA